MFAHFPFFSNDDSHGLRSEFSAHFSFFAVMLPENNRNKIIVKLALAAVHLFLFCGAVSKSAVKCLLLFPLVQSCLSNDTLGKSLARRSIQNTSVTFFYGLAFNCNLSQTQTTNPIIFHLE